ncbi:hypothetical protein JYT28_01550, partial [Desulfobulbus sp. AH-315-M07]|nr:hypothetical protein [Desulfobulbus sp. AH-315-M07]
WASNRKTFSHFTHLRVGQTLSVSVRVSRDAWAGVAIPRAELRSGTVDLVEPNQGMAQSFEILRFQQRMAKRTGHDMEDVYRRVIAVLDDVGAAWTVVGAHALNSYVRPRATDDIDIVVEASKLPEVLKALEQKMGKLQIDDIGAAIRVLDLSVDLIRSDNHVLFRAALEKAVQIGEVRVPPPELLLALKFLASTSPWRKAADRGQDTVDLVRLYQTLGSTLDREGAFRYAASIYPGAERELEQMLRRIDRGEKLQV